MLRVVDEAAVTDTGLQRRANEDAYFARSPVFAVADGMGGARAGEVAARIATDAFEPQIEDQSPAEDTLRGIIASANRHINELASRDSSRTGMGTTLTVALLGEREVTIAHVGDSRAYLFRGDELVRLTRDHSLVEELRRQGRLTDEEAEEHPQRSIITRALGPEPEVEIDTHTHPARADDVFLLCSDGLTTMVSEEELADVLRSFEDLKTVARRLVELANAHGGRDNTTVVTFRLADVDGDGSGDSEGAAQETLAGPAAASVGDAIRREQVGEPGTGIRGEARAPSKIGASDGSTLILDASEAAAARSQRPDPAAPRAAVRFRMRRFALGAALLAVLGASSAGAVLGARQVHFLGTSERGLVSLYRGLPYDLPGGLRLYAREYESGMPASALSGSQRRRLLDHQLRSRRDAVDLVHQLETGRL